MWTQWKRWRVHTAAKDRSCLGSNYSAGGPNMIGQGSNSQRIEKWLTAVVFGPATPAGGLRVTLHHAGIDEAQRLLRTWQLDSIPARQEFLDLVGEVDGEACEDAEQLGWGVQRYLVRAANSQGRELGSLSLRYSTNSLTMEGAFADSEPASARGQVALSMRHTDGAYRLLGAGFGTILDSLNRRLAQQDQVVEKMMESQTTVFGMMQDLAERSLERDVLADIKKKEAELEFLREVQQMDRNQTLLKLGVERVAPLLPILANRFLGNAGAATMPTPRDEILASLLESLNEEQVAAIHKALSPAQMASLHELFQAVQLARGTVKTSSSGTEATSDKLSENAAHIALDEIKKRLLPWTIERLKSGQPLDPTPHMPKETRVFQLLLRALTAEQFKELATTDGEFNKEEQKAFVALAEALGLAPELHKQAGTTPMQHVPGKS
jgi:hypothetical protein